MLLHHIGFVVKNGEKYAQNMLLQPLIKSVFDPIQKANLDLYQGYSNTYIELITPCTPESFTYGFLKKTGGGFHHLCYQVSCVEDMYNIVTIKKLLLIQGPLSALLFEEAPVYFYYSRNKSIIEFLILQNS